MDEVPALSTVLEYPWSFSTVQCAQKYAGHTGVRGVRRRPRAIDIVVAQRDHGVTTFASVGETNVFLVDLRSGIDVPRIDGGVLVGKNWVEISTADRAGGLKPTLGEPLR